MLRKRIEKSQFHEGSIASVSKAGRKVISVYLLSMVVPRVVPAQPIAAPTASPTQEICVTTGGFGTWNSGWGCQQGSGCSRGRYTQSNFLVNMNAPSAGVYQLSLSEWSWCAWAATSWPDIRFVVTVGGNTSASEHSVQLDRGGCCRCSAGCGNREVRPNDSLYFRQGGNAIIFTVYFSGWQCERAEVSLLRNTFCLQHQLAGQPLPTDSPTNAPTDAPTNAPNIPTNAPTTLPTVPPTTLPTSGPAAPQSFQSTLPPSFHPCHSLGQHGCSLPSTFCTDALTPSLPLLGHGAQRYGCACNSSAGFSVRLSSYLCGTASPTATPPPGGYGVPITGNSNGGGGGGDSAVAVAVVCTAIATASLVCLIGAARNRQRARYATKLSRGPCQPNPSYISDDGRRKAGSVTVSQGDQLNVVPLAVEGGTEGRRRAGSVTVNQGDQLYVVPLAVDEGMRGAYEQAVPLNPNYSRRVPPLSGPGALYDVVAYDTVDPRNQMYASVSPPHVPYVNRGGIEQHTIDQKLLRVTDADGYAAPRQDNNLAVPEALAHVSAEQPETTAQTAQLSSEPRDSSGYLSVKGAAQHSYEYDEVTGSTGSRA